MLQPLSKFPVLGFIITLIGLTFVAASIAEGNHTSGHNNHTEHHGEGAHWMSPTGVAEEPNPTKSDAVSIARGKASYVLLCSSCHGASALGDGAAGVGLNPKPTNLKAMSGRHEDGDFAWKIANGRGAMPAWKSMLNKDQIWDLVNFIQNLKNNNDDEKPAEHNYSTHSD